MFSSATSANVWYHETINVKSNFPSIILYLLSLLPKVKVILVRHFSKLTETQWNDVSKIIIVPFANSEGLKANVMVKTLTLEPKDSFEFWGGRTSGFVFQQQARTIEAWWCRIVNVETHFKDIFPYFASNGRIFAFVYRINRTNKRRFSVPLTQIFRNDSELTRTTTKPFPPTTQN